MPHERLQEFVVIDYTREMVIGAPGQETVIGVGQYGIDETTHTAEVLVGNRPMMHLFDKAGFKIEKRREAGVYELRTLF